MRQLLMVGALLALTTSHAHAQESDGQIPDETTALAHEANVDEVDLQGAVNTTHLPPRTYLEVVGELAPKVPANGWPIQGAMGNRIFCIEEIESHHGLKMWNPIPIWDGEHAGGWLGYIPSTARGVGVEIGNRWSEWQGAAYMLAHGRGNEFYGVRAGIC